MPKKVTIQEYRFYIDAYSRERMPMRHLAAYLADLAVAFGEEQSVHFDRIEDGSTVPVVRVEREAAPKVVERLYLAKRKEGPSEAVDALARIDERLRKDNADGYILAPNKKKIIIFPGAHVPPAVEYGPFWQAGVLEGIPIKIGGEKEWVPIHLEGRQDEIHICHAKRSLAKQIASHLFTAVVRVEGKAKWMRHGDGSWELKHFSAMDFKTVGNASIRDDIESLRAIPSEWKNLEDPLGELDIIRHETDIQ